MSRYVLAAEAQQDLREIRDYLVDAAGPRVARYVIGAFVTAFRRLARRPRMGHRREDLTARENLLFWPVLSYVIAYRPDSRPLAIIAVLHGKRDIPALLRQRSL